MMSKRGLPWVLGFVGLAIAAWFLLRPQETKLGGSESMPSGGGEQRRLEGGSGKTADQERALETRSFEGSLARAGGAEEERHVVISGRCVAEEDGSPLEDVRVTLLGAATGPAPSDARLAKNGTREWHPPGSRRTGVDGRFRLRFVPLPTHSFRLVLAHAGRVNRYRYWKQLEPGQRVDLGDLVFDRGVQFRGVVVDSGDRPQAGVVVMAQLAARLRGGDATETGYRREAKTGPDGTFAMKQALRPGVWTLRVRGRELAEPDAGILRLEPAQERVEARLVLRPEDSRRRIRGIVVDERGERIDRGRVDFLGGASCRVWQGRFEHLKEDGFAGFAEGPFEVVVTAAGFEPKRLDRKLSWGDDDVRIVLEAGLRLELLVTEAGTGGPLKTSEFFSRPPHGWRGLTQATVGACWPTDTILVVG